MSTYQLSHYPKNPITFKQVLSENMTAEKKIHQPSSFHTQELEERLQNLMIHRRKSRAPNYQSKKEKESYEAYQA